MPAAGRLGLSADEVLTTTRAVRKRLDLERLVPREVLVECVDIAHQSPSGSNSGLGSCWTTMHLADERQASAGRIGHPLERMVRVKPS